MSELEEALPPVAPRLPLHEPLDKPTELPEHYCVGCGFRHPFLQCRYLTLPDNFERRQSWLLKLVDVIKLQKGARGNQNLNINAKT